MGIHWLHKASGGVDDGSSGGGKSPATKPETRKKARDRNRSFSGCMTVILNLFDVQRHQHFRMHHPSFMSATPTVTNHQHSNLSLQVNEAPRGSLESPESAMDGAHTSLKAKEQTNLRIQVGKIQIKTNPSRFTEDLSSECSNSPGTKTPNLVARLMGLDLLPEYSSPRPSSSSAPANSHHHSRSLPSTPRISTVSRRSTDTDYHHRLSLQIDKENGNGCRGQERQRRSEFPVNQQDDRLKSEYAKKITNQVRERISRRLGTDITNTVSPAICRDQRRDSDLVLLKPKKSPTVAVDRLNRQPPEKSVPDKPLRLANSPKQKLLDIKTNLNKPISISDSHSSSNKEVKLKYETPNGHKPPLMKQEKAVKDEKIKRIASERYNKKKQSALPNHVLNVKNTTKIVCLKKEMTSSSSTARSSQLLQVSLPSSLNSSYKADNTHNQNATTTTTNSAADGGGSFSDHLNYISRILNQCGIDTATPISTGQWHSHSHPLHPSIFNQLEKLHHPTATATRRMIFDFVDDSLAEILKPHMNHKPYSCVIYGSDLIRRLDDMIGSSPAAHCEVLEDIDRLVEGDMGRSTRRLVATEAEDIVKEIEGEIVKSLVCEIATETVAPAGKV